MASSRRPVLSLRTSDRRLLFAKAKAVWQSVHLPRRGDLYGRPAEECTKTRNSEADPYRLCGSAVRYSLYSDSPVSRKPKRLYQKQTAPGLGGTKPDTTVGAGVLDSPAVFLKNMIGLWANTRKNRVYSPAIVHDPVLFRTSRRGRRPLQGTARDGERFVKRSPDVAASRSRGSSIRFFVADAPQNDCL